MKYYIYENRIWVFNDDISSTNIVSHDINDNFDSEKRLPKYIEISESQYQFHLDHPTASMQEVWNMELTPPYIQTNEDISRNRQEQYKQRSDSYYISWQKDLALGELEKAEISKAKWLNEVQLIEQENPYNA